MTESAGPLTTLESLVERDRAHDCAGVGPQQVCVRVVAVGQDPPDHLTSFMEEQGQRVQTLSEPAPYAVSEAYGLEAVPTIFLVGQDGEIEQAIPGWSRDLWNELATAAGMSEPLSTPDEGLRPFRPG